MNIRVSAFAFELEENDISQASNGMKFSADFATYMPVKGSPRPSNFVFFGILYDFTEVTINGYSSGYITKIKLISEIDNSDLNIFTVDIFINKEHLRINELKTGMKVRGTLLFNGEIA